MAKYSLLDIVNSTLESMDSFRVATIDDVLEAGQIASIAEDVFYEMETDLFHSQVNQKTIQLESLADSTKPNYLKIPDDVINIHQSLIRYNVTTGAAGTSTVIMKDIPYLHPQDFMDKIGGRSTQTTNTELVTDFSGLQMVVKNKVAPSFCTSFDGVYLVFDSYDSDVDSVLQQSKNICVVSYGRAFTKTSGYMIDLPEWFQPTYLNLVKARAHEYLRGEPSLTDMRKGRSGLVKAKNRLRVGNSKFQKRRYGR